MPIEIHSIRIDTSKLTPTQVHSFFNPEQTQFDDIKQLQSYFLNTFGMVIMNEHAAQFKLFLHGMNIGFLRIVSETESVAATERTSELKTVRVY